VEHLHHFKLAEDPFRNEPLLRNLFESPQQQEALRRMDRAVRQAKGLCVLIGDVGSGKTVAVRQLFENLEEEVFEASMMVVLNGAADANASPSSARTVVTRF
jgi:general secretion pathway protein A